MDNKYCDWFMKLIRILVDIFFMFIPLVTLYVFTSVFQGIVKYILFGFLIVAYLLVIYFAKDKIRSFLKGMLEYLERCSDKKMLLILVVMMIVLRVIYTIFFNYDATSINGDIVIYNDIADQIIATGTIRSDAISHLFAVAIHFVPFKLLHIPIEYGMFVPFFLGTVFNFFSFKEIIGKEKTFLLFIIYLLMPSSILYSFCPTHEVFFYFYLSASLYFINKLLKSTDTAKIVTNAILCVLFIILAVFINPVGYIIYVILLLIILLSRKDLKTKGVVFAVLLLAVLGSRCLDKFLEVNEYRTATNTYTILIHGSNPYSLGEQVDGYPHDQTCFYLADHGLEYNHENYLIGMRAVLLGQYKYLLTHPLTLVQLIVHKYYLLWSGNHYPIEMAHVFGDMPNVVYYLLLIASTLIYLFMITVRNVYKTKKEDDIFISTYKLVLLGVFAVTMLSVVLNKYAVYMTPYLYLLTMYEGDFSDER